MNLEDILGSRNIYDPERGVEELLQFFIIRTNFIPGIRHNLGWRGVKDVSKGHFAWTAKVSSMEGVFGLAYHEAENTEDKLTGSFTVHYFPRIDEETVEDYSLHAAALTTHSNYTDFIRDFPAYPEFASLFHIADILLSLSMKGDSFSLALEALSRNRTIALDGVRAEKNGEEYELVAPGSYDQDFSAFDTAYNFFRVLAASITFNIGESPRILVSRNYPGYAMSYNGRGGFFKVGSEEVSLKMLGLGYGSANASSMFGHALFDKKEQAEKECLWEKGSAIPEEYQEELWWHAHDIVDRSASGPRIFNEGTRPSLIILTGFLGSGKTSFIKNFIEYHTQYNRFVAVIQNEIGEIGLDGKLLNHDYAVTEVDEGCVCCTLVGSVKRGIREIMGRFLPDYIILETTGLANPFNLFDELSEIEDLVSFDSVTTVVDAYNIDVSLERFEIATRQIEAADILLINKVDLVSKEELDGTTKTLKRLNERAAVVTCCGADINPSLLYGIDPEENENRAGKRGYGTAEHHGNHGKEGLSSIKVSLCQTVPQKEFIQAIENMPSTVFRIKGIVEFTHSRTPYLLQYVNGRFELSEYGNKNFEERFLTVIGKNMDCDAIESILKSFTCEDDQENKNFSDLVTLEIR